MSRRTHVNELHSLYAVFKKLVVPMSDDVPKFMMVHLCAYSLQSCLKRIRRSYFGVTPELEEGECGVLAI